MVLKPVPRPSSEVVEEVRSILEMADLDMVNAMIEESRSVGFIRDYIKERGITVSPKAVATYRFLYLKAKEDHVPVEELLASELDTVRGTKLGASFLAEMADLWSDIDSLNRIIQEGTDLVIATQDISAKDVINAVNVKSHVLSRSNERLVQYVAELTRALERVLDIVKEVLPPQYLEIIQKRLEEEFGE